VKPANILITNEGQVKLGDFGIARFATQVSGSGNILGTPAYLSPEQIQGHKQDSRSDLFSLGIILYQMTTGVRPFDGTSVGAVCAQIISAEPPPPSYHNPELPPEFDHVVMRCLAKNPANRYATAEALGASLYPFARSKPLDELPELRSWWKRPMQTSDLRAAAGVLLALAVLGIGARAVVHHRSSQSAAHMDAKPGVIVQLPETASANDAAPANSVAMSSSASLINVGSADVSSPEQPSEFSNLTDRSDAQPGTQSPSGVIASHAFERHPIATVKSKPLHVSTGPGAAPALSSPASFSGRPTGVSSAPKPELAATAAKAPLHIDVVSTVVDETLSVYAGDELLLSTPLEAAHLGDTMRFDCPVSPGEHAFRVVLSRADESVLLEKDSTSQIRADGTNFLGVHITRRTKLLLKHETSLEVVWPSTNAPIAAGVTPRSIEALAMR
jgi:serine/threonine protein kinase